MLSVKLAPNLTGTVYPKVLFPDPRDITLQRFVTLGAFWSPVRIILTGFVLVIRRRGDRQLLTDRLDPVCVLMLVNKGDKYFGRQSSCAWAKKAEPLRRISFARFNSRFSRLSSSSCSRSEVVMPAR